MPSAFHLPPWTALAAAMVTSLLPLAGWAYCVDNRTGEAIHVQSLDATGFNADAPPGGSACCHTAGCVGRDGRASLMVMTGYVPLGGGGSPGWRGDCRARPAAEERVTVTGGGQSITCRIGGGG